MNQPALGHRDPGCDDFCYEPDPHSEAVCVRQFGHAGAHQSRLCDATCDTCDCAFWCSGYDNAGLALPEGAR